jgi:hypothetical protein
MRHSWVALALLSVTLSAPAGAAELNETFATATQLAPGVLSVEDELTLRHAYPDTLLGIQSSSGTIIESLVNDDDSIYGNGFASGLRNVPVDADSIRFAITGIGDSMFSGDHTVEGQYEVFVDVYDAADQLLDAFSEVRTLMPGTVDEYSFADAAWSGGNFDVNINNINSPNDIDFYTFHGLTPGANFSARTDIVDTADVDTILGWYDAAGNLLVSNDDGGGGILSLIQGTVRLNGELTLAVTGFGDFLFEGSHSQYGEYQLSVTQGAVGDYNRNGVVDAADYVVWRNTLGQSGPGLAADGDPNDQVDNGDYLVWKSHFGETAGSGALASVHGNAVPEPSTALLVAWNAAILFATMRRNLV